MTKYVRMLNNGSNMLDEILEVRKISRNMVLLHLHEQRTQSSL